MTRMLLLAVMALAGCRPAEQAPVAPAEPAAAASEPQAAAEQAPPAADTDTDQDGVPDRDDLCPHEAMAMGPACADDPARKRGCPDDCRALTPVP